MSVAGATGLPLEVRGGEWGFGGLWRSKTKRRSRLEVVDTVLSGGEGAQWLFTSKHGTVLRKSGGRTTGARLYAMLARHAALHASAFGEALTDRGERPFCVARDFGAGSLRVYTAQEYVSAFGAGAAPSVPCFQPYLPPRNLFRAAVAASPPDRPFFPTASHKHEWSVYLGGPHAMDPRPVSKSSAYHALPGRPGELQEDLCRDRAVCAAMDAAAAELVTSIQTTRRVRVAKLVTEFCVFDDPIAHPDAASSAKLAARGGHEGGRGFPLPDGGRMVLVNIERVEFVHMPKPSKPDPTRPSSPKLSGTVVTAVLPPSDATERATPEESGAEGKEGLHLLPEVDSVPDEDLDERVFSKLPSLLGSEQLEAVSLAREVLGPREAAKLAARLVAAGGAGTGVGVADVSPRGKRGGGGGRRRRGGGGEEEDGEDGGGGEWDGDGEEEEEEDMHPLVVRRSGGRGGRGGKVGEGDEVGERGEAGGGERAGALAVDEAASQILEASDLLEMSTLSHPPAGVELAASALLVLADGDAPPWRSARRLLAKASGHDLARRAMKITEVDPDRLSLLIPLCSNPAFQPESMVAVSRAASRVASWVLARVDAAADEEDRKRIVHMAEERRGKMGRDHLHTATSLEPALSEEGEERGSGGGGGGGEGGGGMVQKLPLGMASPPRDAASPAPQKPGLWTSGIATHGSTRRAAPSPKQRTAKRGGERGRREEMGRREGVDEDEGIVDSVEEFERSLAAEEARIVREEEGELVAPQPSMEASDRDGDSLYSASNPPSAPSSPEASPRHSGSPPPPPLGPYGPRAPIPDSGERVFLCADGVTSLRFVILGPPRSLAGDAALPGLGKTSAAAAAGGAAAVGKHSFVVVPDLFDSYRTMLPTLRPLVRRNKLRFLLVSLPGQPGTTFPGWDQDRTSSSDATREGRGGEEASSSPVEGGKGEEEEEEDGSGRESGSAESKTEAEKKKQEEEEEEGRGGGGGGEGDTVRKASARPLDNEFLAARLFELLAFLDSTGEFPTGPSPGGAVERQEPPSRRSDGGSRRGRGGTSGARRRGGGMSATEMLASGHGTRMLSRSRGKGRRSGSGGGGGGSGSGRHGLTNTAPLPSTSASPAWGVQRWHLVGCGCGVNVALTMSLRFGAAFGGLLSSVVSINGMARVDAQLGAVLHSSINVFSCFPDARPDLALGYFQRFQVSAPFLDGAEAAERAMALVEPPARPTPPPDVDRVASPSSIPTDVISALLSPAPGGPSTTGRIQLCRGALSFADLRTDVPALPLPLILIESVGDQLVPPGPSAAELARGRAVRHVFNRVTAGLQRADTAAEDREAREWEMPRIGGEGEAARIARRAAERGQGLPPSSTAPVLGPEAIRALHEVLTRPQVPTTASLSRMDAETSAARAIAAEHGFGALALWLKGAHEVRIEAPCVLRQLFAILSDPDAAMEEAQDLIEARSFDLEEAAASAISRAQVSVFATDFKEEESLDHRIGAAVAIGGDPASVLPSVAADVAIHPLSLLNPSQRLRQKQQMRSGKSRGSLPSLPSLSQSPSGSVRSAPRGSGRRIGSSAPMLPPPVGGGRSLLEDPVGRRGRRGKKSRLKERDRGRRKRGTTGIRSGFRDAVSAQDFAVGPAKFEEGSDDDIARGVGTASGSGSSEEEDDGEESKQSLEEEEVGGGDDDYDGSERRKHEIAEMRRARERMRAGMQADADSDGPEMEAAAELIREMALAELRGSKLGDASVEEKESEAALGAALARRTIAKGQAERAEKWRKETQVMVELVVKGVARAELERRASAALAAKVMAKRTKIVAKSERKAAAAFAATRSPIRKVHAVSIRRALDTNTSGAGHVQSEGSGKLSDRIPAGDLLAIATLKRAIEPHPASAAPLMPRLRAYEFSRVTDELEEAADEWRRAKAIRDAAAKAAEEAYWRPIRVSAATVIQSQARVWFARRQVRRMRFARLLQSRRTRAVRFLQIRIREWTTKLRANRDRLARIRSHFRNECAATLQRAWRCHVARCSLQAMRAVRAANRLASATRIFLAKQRARRRRKKMLEDRLNGKSATKIQAIWRGYAARLGYAEIMILVQAAKTVQRLWRGYLGRLRARAVRAYKASAEGVERLQHGIELVERESKLFRRHRSRLGVIERSVARTEQRRQRTERRWKAVCRELRGAIAERDRIRALGKELAQWGDDRDAAARAVAAVDAKESERARAKAKAGSFALSAIAQEADKLGVSRLAGGIGKAVEKKLRRRGAASAADVLAREAEEHAERLALELAAREAEMTEVLLAARLARAEQAQRLSTASSVVQSLEKEKKKLERALRQLNRQADTLRRQRDRLRTEAGKQAGAVLELIQQQQREFREVEAKKRVAAMRAKAMAESKRIEDALANIRKHSAVALRAVEEETIAARRHFMTKQAAPLFVASMTTLDAVVEGRAGASMRALEILSGTGTTAFQSLFFRQDPSTVRFEELPSTPRLRADGFSLPALTDGASSSTALVTSSTTSSSTALAPVVPVLASSDAVPDPVPRPQTQMHHYRSGSGGGGGGGEGSTALVRGLGMPGEDAEEDVRDLVPVSYATLRDGTAIAHPSDEEDARRTLETLPAAPKARRSALRAYELRRQKRFDDRAEMRRRRKQRRIAAEARAQVAVQAARATLGLKPHESSDELGARAAMQRMHRRKKRMESLRKREFDPISEVAMVAPPGWADEELEEKRQKRAARRLQLRANRAAGLKDDEDEDAVSSGAEEEAEADEDFRTDGSAVVRFRREDPRTVALGSTTLLDVAAETGLTHAQRQSRLYLSFATGAERLSDIEYASKLRASGAPAEAIRAEVERTRERDTDRFFPSKRLLLGDEHRAAEAHEAERRRGHRERASAESTRRRSSKTELERRLETMASDDAGSVDSAEELAQAHSLVVQDRRNFDVVLAEAESRMQHGELPLDVRDWRPEHVAKWLRGIRLGEYASRIREAEVDGPFLLAMPPEDIRDFLGIDNPHHVRRLHNARLYLAPPPDTILPKGSAERKAWFRGRYSGTIRLPAAARSRRQLPDTLEMADGRKPSVPVVFAQVRAGRLNRLEEALACGFPADSIDEGDKFDGEVTQRTALHIAAMVADQRAIACLIRYGANPNAVDIFGNTPLHYAYEADEEAAEALLDRGADSRIRNNLRRLAIEKDTGIDLETGLPREIVRGPDETPLPAAVESAKVEALRLPRIG